MTIMMKINEIWSELEKDTSFTKGLLMRRYSGIVLPDIFVALQQPEKLLCIAVSINKDIEIDITSFLKLQEIQEELLNANNNSESQTLLFKLINPLHKDIFSVLCEDLITSVTSETNQRKLVKTILNRFEKWKSLFNKISSNGLCPEEQRGLYGELYFLRKFLLLTSEHQKVINSWVGSAKEI